MSYSVKPGNVTSQNDLAVVTTSESLDYSPYTERPETYIVPVVFAVIFIVGVLGNGTLVFIFVRHRNMRTVPNTYIFSLALGDLLVIITCVPVTSTIYTVESWPYGAVVCKLSEYFKDVSIAVSVFTLTALSAERYCVIVNPIRRHVGGGHVTAKPVTLVVAVGIWVLAVVFALPSVLFSDLESRLVGGNHTIVFCTPFPHDYGMIYRQAIVMFKFLAYYAIPLIVIAFFYVLMARHLELSTRNMPGELQGQSTQVRGRKKVAKMVLAFVFIFIACFLPYHTFSLWFHFSPTSEQDYDDYWHAFRIIGFCLSFINSCINPVTLYCVSGTFRKHFNRYLFCCCGGPGSRGRAFSRKGDGSSTVCETSSHTMVHFHSTLRRHHKQQLEDGLSCDTTHTALFAAEKT
ncbi:neuropeptide CCHamide-1 receptor-like [Bacillus rossius redtenbacheri]|uniref:neuropeptide CCHamide-1 receptor-like n=1 Tax=Bacillus rossius redtenbacheri TaxID=93214 RepID=UPI002FDEDB9C